MNTFSNRFVPRVLAGTLLVVGISGVSAQMASGSGAAQGAGSPTAATSVPRDPRLAVTDAQTLVRNNDVAGAKRRLASENAHQPDTAPWHIETSHRLLQLADTLVREGSPVQSSAVVSECLAELDQASLRGRAANDVPAQVRAKTLAGFVEERYRGNIANAIAAYEAAIRLDPADKGAQEALGRLQRADAMLRAKFEANKRSKKG